MSCNHEECEPYEQCVARTERERHHAFWAHRNLGDPTTEDWGTDPLAWLNGDMPDE